MKIEWLPIKAVTPADYNPRKDLQPKHKEYKRLKKSIQEFGFVDPLIWNQTTGRLIGGHQRLKVLKDLGYERIPVSVVELSEEKEKALNLALNQIDGGWDQDMLTELLSDLDEELRVLAGFDRFEAQKFLGKEPKPIEEFVELEDEIEEDMVCPKCGHRWYSYS